LTFFINYKVERPSVVQHSDVNEDTWWFILGTTSDSGWDQWRVLLNTMMNLLQVP